MYGTGELPQAFCRLCAVFGGKPNIVLFLEVNQTWSLAVKPNESLQGVYYLGRSLEGLVVKEGTAQAVVTEGRRIQCDQVNLHVTGVM